MDDEANAAAVPVVAPKGGGKIVPIMLVMNKRGADKLLSSKFTLGADASVAAGPVGRTSSAN